MVLGINQIYIHLRPERVIVREGISDLLDLSSGVLQGSILGLFSYIIYISAVSGHEISCNVDLGVNGAQLCAPSATDQALKIIVENISQIHYYPAMVCSGELGQPGVVRLYNLTALSSIWVCLCKIILC